MKKWITYGVWACLYLICACLGLAEEPTGFGLVLCILMSVCFFIPGALLLFWSYREDDSKTRKTVRWISLCVLMATLALLVLTVLSAQRFPEAGLGLHIILVLVSTPMVGSHRWGLVLFLWACLLMATFLKKKELRIRPLKDL